MPDLPRPAGAKRRPPHADRPLRVLTRVFVLLVASVGIWFYAHNQITATIEVNAPFQLRSLDSDVAILGKDIPSSVRLLVSGPRSRIESLGDVHAWINVRKDGKSQEPFFLSLRGLQTNLPPEFRVEPAPDAPTAITNLRADQWQKVLVPVVVTLQNEESLAARGLRLERPPYRIIPSRVSVRVPRSVAAAGGLVLRASPIDLSNAIPDHSETLAFENGSDLKPLEPVQIHLNLAAIQERQIENVPVRVLAPPGYPFVCVLQERDRLIPILRIVGEPQAVRALAPADIVAFVPVPDPAKVQPGDPYAQEVRFLLPPGVSIADPSPRQVNLTLKAPDKKE